MNDDRETNAIPSDNDIEESERTFDGGMKNLNGAGTKDADAGGGVDRGAKHDDSDNDVHDDSPMVELANGTNVSLDELKRGYLRQKDYTVKIQHLAEEREQLENSIKRHQRFSASLKERHQKLVEYLEGLIPPEPDAELARTNPTDYQHQNAVRTQAINELQNLMNDKQEADSQDQARQDQEFDHYRRTESKMLLKTFPELKDMKTREKFMRGLIDGARDFGFSDNELSETYDHRVLSLLHYARIGKNAMLKQAN